jgi:hypothetical protein
MMPAGNSPQVAAKDADALIFARVWGGLIAVCGLGGLASAVVPLFFQSTNTPGSRVAVMFLSLANHIIALITAIMLLIGLRSARFALLLTIALTICTLRFYFVTLRSYRSSLVRIRPPSLCSALAFDILAAGTVSLDVVRREVAENA